MKRKKIKVRDSDNTHEVITKIDKELLKCETHGSTVHVTWDEESVTPNGQFVFFAHFLKVSGVFDNWVADCPSLRVKDEDFSPQKKRDVLGALLLGILSGHKRYAHINSIRFDEVNPPMLGMSKVYSEDTIRRSFQEAAQDECHAWMKKHISHCYEPLLREEWILDVDTTVKPLYGHQEGAEIGYNPQKPGRPSHVVHAYVMAETRLILDSEVMPGTTSSSFYSMPRLLEMLKEWDPEERPSLVRGDCGYGNENVIAPLEELGVHYLFKLKKTKGVKDLVQLVNRQDSKWMAAGQGWEGVTSNIKLSGWSKRRRVVILRKPLKKKNSRRLARAKKDPQPYLPGFEWMAIPEPVYEYAILITSLDEQELSRVLQAATERLKATAHVPDADIGAIENISEDLLIKQNAEWQGATENTPIIPSTGSLFVAQIAQLYRDRATSENNWDELKNQWGWGGFVTKDLFRSQITARIVALVYNWWTLFTRWVDPDKHREGITSRPLMLHGVGRQTKHGGQTHLKVTPLHAHKAKIQKAMNQISNFLQEVKTYAERVMTQMQRWLVLSVIFRQYLNGRPLTCPPDW